MSVLTRRQPGAAGPIRLHAARWRSLIGHAYVAVTLAAIAGAAVLTFSQAPTEDGIGPMERLICLHVPAAFAMFAAAFAVCVGGLMYLWTRRRRWDRLAAAGAVGAVVSSGIVLLSGMAWGRLYWGFWWTWSPRLTFTLALFALYVAYLVVRWRVKPRARAAVVAAVFGAVAFVDVPLVYLSVRMLPDVHPTTIPLSPGMRDALLLATAAGLLVCGGAIAWPFVRALRRVDRAGGRRQHA